MIESETRIATAKAKEDGKPDAILPRIIEGSLKKYKDEFVLMLQPYIRDESIYRAGTGEPEHCRPGREHHRAPLCPLGTGRNDR